MGLAYNFRVHCPHGREHGSTQIDMVAEKSSTSRSEGSKKRESCWAWLLFLKPQSSPSVAHFLQQDHTYPNKASPPNPFDLKFCHTLVTNFEFMNLWRPFLFKPPQSSKVIIWGDIPGVGKLINATKIHTITCVAHFLLLSNSLMLRVMFVCCSFKE